MSVQRTLIVKCAIGAAIAIIFGILIAFVMFRNARIALANEPAGLGAVPIAKGPLVVRLHNNCKKPVQVFVALDGVAVMYACLPRNGIFSRLFEREYVVKSAFVCAPGQHKIEVYEPGGQKIGEKEVNQRKDTNYWVGIGINPVPLGNKRSECLITVDEIAK